MKEFNKSKKISKRRGKSKGPQEVKPNNEMCNKDAKLENQSPVGNPNWYFTDHELAEQASRFSFRSFVR